MTQHQEGELSPEIVLAQMKENGITHVVWLPDSETNFLYLLMEADPDLDLIPVSRERKLVSLSGSQTTWVIPGAPPQVSPGLSGPPAVKRYLRDIKSHPHRWLSLSKPSSLK